MSLNFWALFKKHRHHQSDFTNKNFNKLEKIDIFFNLFGQT